MPQRRTEHSEHVDKQSTKQKRLSDPAEPGETNTQRSLSALLSQTLVAFTIEFDNEFEHRMPHQTTRYGKTQNAPYTPWLVSLVMWYNCMRFVDEKSITVSDLQRLARTGTNLDGMRRWGYVHIHPGTPGPKKIQPDASLRATAAGLQARIIWQSLFSEIEARWYERFSREEIERLRGVLETLVSQFSANLPDCLPILGYGLYSKGHNPAEDRFASKNVDHDEGTRDERNTGNDSSKSLYTLLAQTLLMFALEFEHASDLSLAISANVLRILGEQTVQIRNLPLLSGVSKEAISMAIGILQERHMVIVEPDPAGSRFNIIHLNDRGLQAWNKARQLLVTIEEQWQDSFGKETIQTLRESLERLVGVPAAQRSPLFKGLEPYPDGWRAQVPPPQALPHFPMVLHRGGFPDGS